MTLAALLALGIDAAPTDLAWLSGCWRGTSGTTTTEECWTPADGGLLLGTNRTLKDGAATGFEFLRIAAEGERVVYWAAPGGRHPPTPFVLTELKAGRAVFANPGHDFPKSLTYTRTDDALVVQVEADGQGFELRWTRAVR